MHAYYHALVYSLLFLSNSFFFFLSFLLHFSLFFLFLCGVVMFTIFFLSSSFVPPSLLYTAEGPFILPNWRVFTILPFNCFCLGVGVLPYHPLVCQLPSHHYLPVLVMPHLITKQRILFCLLAHYGIPIRIRVGILSHYPSWHAPSDSNSYFSLLGGMSSQQDIFPKRVWARTPK